MRAMSHQERFQGWSASTTHRQEIFEEANHSLARRASRDTTTTNPEHSQAWKDLRSLTHALATLVFVAMVSGQSIGAEKTGAQTPAEGAPHIVVILADDMGYGDLKAYNPDSRISTPHLDQLAADGMTFTDAHSGGSTCKPSRYSLLTGQFAVRCNSFNDRMPIIPDGRQTVAGFLKANGYATAMVGKWHLGFDRKLKNAPRTGLDFNYDLPITGGPVDRGFDSFFGMHASLDIPPYFYIRDRAPTKAPTDNVDASSSVGGKENWNNIQGAFWRAGPVAPDFKHDEVTPRFAAEAVKVIESHDAAQQPLFLYLALPSPHTPWLPTEEFAGKSKAGMYGDFMMQVDSVVGQILTALDKANMADNTLVIFTSDNGPVWYEKDIERFGHRSVGPLRGIKGSSWEGGHRVPFIVRWPERVKRGAVNKNPIAFADVYATLAAAAGKAKLPADTAEDSESFLSHLVSDGESHPERGPILHNNKVIRDGPWKLILANASRGFGADRKRAKTTELYNLAEDVSETKNLAETEPERVKSLQMKLKEILEK